MATSYQAQPTRNPKHLRDTEHQSLRKRSALGVGVHACSALWCILITLRCRGDITPQRKRLL